MNNKMFEVINSVDDGCKKVEVIEELHSFHLDTKPAILKLIDKMITMELLEETSGYVSVTTKGRDFYKKASYQEI